MKKEAYFRSKLLKRLGELDTRLHAIEAELDEPMSKDWQDKAVEREGDEVLEHLGQSGEAEIARIRAALQRIREGEYGDCVECGDEIAQERLEIVPDTPFCQRCAAKHA